MFDIQQTKISTAFPWNKFRLCLIENRSSLVVLRLRLKSTGHYRNATAIYILQDDNNISNVQTFLYFRFRSYSICANLHVPCCNCLRINTIYFVSSLKDTNADATLSGDGNDQSFTFRTYVTIGGVPGIDAIKWLLYPWCYQISVIS